MKEKITDKVKLVFFAVLFVFILVFSLNTMVDSASKIIKKEASQYTKNIGKDIILNKDTLKIIDYSSLKGSYYLSNGIEINKEFVNKQLGEQND